MKIVAQIVKDATLVIHNEVVNRLPFGYLLLVSFQAGDSEETVAKMADKIIKMRVFPDREGKTNLSIKDVNGAIMSISQFTLYGVFKGLRPSFTNVLKREASSALYDYFNDLLAAEVNVVRGVFGADMALTFTNMGPATYIIDSDE